MSSTESQAVPPKAIQSAKPGKPVKPKGIRQTMSDLHIWTGLLVGWILYAMFLTGTVAYFRDEMSAWMRPELPAAVQREDAAIVAQRLVDAMAREHAPSAPQWTITLPTPRNATASAFWRNPPGEGPRFGNGVLDATSGQRLQARETRGGDFFYAFHFNFHYMPVLWARWLAGFCAMFMLVAIVSGVITHKKIFADFFTFRWGKGQRSWLDGHAALSVLGLPFHFMITWSGLVTLMLLYLPFASDVAFQTPQQRQQLTAEMSAFVPAGPPSGQAAELAPIAPMVQKAQQHWQGQQVGRITIHNPGDASARVTLVPSEQGRVSTSPRYIVFHGTTGDIMETKDRVGAAAQTRGVLYGLHLGRFADTVTRWMYFLVSLAGTAMVGSGLVLWTVKRRTRLPDPLKPYFGFALVERLNIAAIAGLSAAMAAFFWCNRLLPLHTAERAQWEIHGFFIVWAGTLAWALVRPAKKAWVELLALAAVLLALLPVLNAFSTDRPLWRSLWEGDWVFAGFELSLLAFAALHAHLAWRTHQYQPKAKPVRKTKPTAKAIEAEGEMA